MTVAGAKIKCQWSVGLQKNVLYSIVVYSYSSSQCNIAVQLQELMCRMGSRTDIPVFTPAEAGTRFNDPGGMQG